MFLASHFVVGQASFSDDFESYNANAFIAQSSPSWRTWSNNGAGTSEDARVSDEKAFSGTKSLKLVSTSTAGGPTDIILPFGKQYTDGTFTLTMKMYVVAGTGAYFNFQANQTIGQVWAADFYFRQNGEVEVQTSGTSQGKNTFPHDQWFDVVCALDLTNNDWQITVDGNKVAGFSNPTNNRVAHLNLYPYNPQGTSTWYIDDMAWEHKPFVKPELDVSLFSLNTKTNSIAGASQPLAVTVRNLGTQNIHSFDVSWTDGTTEYTDQITGLNLADGQNHTFTHSQPLVAGAGSTLYTVSISNINGSNDENPNNDVRTVTVTGIVPAAHKRTVAEEGTGTWCGWCPRGTIFMDRMNHEYPDYFVPIAVHNNDPMAFATYNSGITSFPGFTGFPGVIFDRTVVIDPSALESNVFTHVVNEPVAKLTNGASYDAATGELIVSVTADFLKNAIGTWRLNVVITEDGITGTGSGYNQANYYSGGGSGPMGGYESLPNPVPAAQMVYDHVARAILGEFPGVSGVVPNPTMTGETVIHQFNWTVPANVNPDNLHVISMILAPNGRINNANSFTLDQAIANGLASSNNDVKVIRGMEVFPNPAQDLITLRLDLESAENLFLTLTDILGKPMYQQMIAGVFGQQMIQIPVDQLPQGLYYLQIRSGNNVTSKAVTIQR